MGCDLDLDDAVAGYPEAKRELEELRAERDALAELLRGAQYFVPSGLLRDRIDAALAAPEKP